MRHYEEGDSELQIVPLMAALERHGVRYVTVGSTAAIVQGIDLVLTDLDIVPAIDHENLTRLVDVLEEIGALEKRGEDIQNISSLIDNPVLLLDATVWTFVTNYGEMDLVLRPAGFEGGYVALIDKARVVELKDDRDPRSVVRAIIADVGDVYESKRKAARPKDIRALPHFIGNHPKNYKELMRQRYRRMQQHNPSDIDASTYYQMPNPPPERPTEPPGKD